MYTTADGSTVANEGEKTLIMSTADGAHLRKVTFQGANVNKAYGSVSKMVRNGNRVVFDTSGSYIENKMTRDMMVAPPGREQKSKPFFFGGGGTCSRAFLSK